MKGYVVTMYLHVSGYLMRLLRVEDWGFYPLGYLHLLGTKIEAGLSMD